MKKITLSIMIIVSLGLTIASAQMSLHVIEKTGTPTAFTIASIRKLTFGTGDVTVLKKDNTSQTYTLTAVRNLNFINMVTELVSTDKSVSSIKVYPNPSLDELNIVTSFLNTEPIFVEIMDIQGHIVFKQEVGIGNTKIAISQLEKGTYICRMNQGNKTESVKFIKN